MIFLGGVFALLQFELSLLQIHYSTDSTDPFELAGAKVSFLWTQEYTKKKVNFKVIK